MLKYSRWLWTQYNLILKLIRSVMHISQTLKPNIGNLLLLQTVINAFHSTLGVTTDPILTF